MNGGIGSLIIAAAMLVLCSWYWDRMRVERWRESHPSGRLPVTEVGKMDRSRDLPPPTPPAA